MVRCSEVEARGYTLLGSSTGISTFASANVVQQIILSHFQLLLIRLPHILPLRHLPTSLLLHRINSGNSAAAQMPALTGDCTTSAGAVATSCTKSGGNLFTSTTSGASLNLSTLLSQDCTIGATGVVTCTKSG